MGTSNTRILKIFWAIWLACLSLSVTQASTLSSVKVLAPIDVSGINIFIPAVFDPPGKYSYGDFDGDGFQDVFIQGATGNDSSYLMLGDGSGYQRLHRQWQNGHLGLNWSADNSEVYVGDFDGEGTTDLMVTTEISGGTNAILYSDPSANFNSLSTTWTNPAAVTDTGPEIRVIESIVMIPMDGLNVPIVTYLDPAGNKYYADFNGDGRLDLLVQGHNVGDTTYLLLADADGNYSKIHNSWIGNEYNGQSWTADKVTIFIGDYNTDGRADIILESNNIDGENALFFATTSGDLNEGTQSIVWNDWEQNNSSSSTINTIAGQLEVAPNGSASYSIPITVPPGVAGMAPSISINYNSQGGNGNLGVGWSLGGLSTISRCPATYDQDGFKGGVKFDGNDRFCLDGQRLIETGTESIAGYGTGRGFRTEIESYSRVVGFGSQGSGPAFFVVQTKSGQTMEYGVGNRGRIEAQGRSDVLIWAINKTYDTVGNEIIFTYDEYDVGKTGEYNISRIDYSSQSVVFEYDSVRPDKPIYFVSGSKKLNTKRLTRIKTYTAGYPSPIYDYRIKYSASANTQRSRIKDITLCTSDGSCSRSTRFTWRGSTSDSDFLFKRDVAGLEGVPFWADPGHQSVLTGDFDGDGLTDIVNIQSDGNQWLGLSNGNGGFQFRGHVGGIEGVPFWAGVQHHTVLTGDFDGNGLTDIINLQSDGNQWLALSNGDGNFTLKQHLAGIEGVPYWADTANQTLLTGDFNGDGLTDVVNIQSDGNQWLGLSNGNGTFQFRGHVGGIEGVPFWAGAQHHTVLTGDFDGNGLTDIINLQSDGNQWVALSNGDGNFTLKHYVAGIEGVAYWADTANQTLLTGDFNGDGLTDIANIQSDGNQWVGLSKGNGNFKIIHSVGGIEGVPFWAGAQHHKLTVGDFNGDGLADIVNIQSDGNQWLALSKGNGHFTLKHNPAGLEGQPFWSNTSSQSLHTGDFNGDGLTDIINLQSDGNQWLALRSGPFPDLLKEIRKGWGTYNLEAQIEYVSLTNDYYYTKGSGAKYPYIDLRGPMYVVGRVSSPNGVGHGLNRVSYHYSGAKLHLRGRGFLGFSQVKATDNMTQIVSTSDYIQSYPYIGLVSQSTRMLYGVQLSKTVNTPYYLYYGGTRYFPYIGRSVTETREYNTNAIVTKVTNETSYSASGTGYHTYGDPQYVTVTAEGGGKVFTTQTYNTYYAANTANWILGRLERSRVTKSISGQPGKTKTRTSSFTYVPATGLLASETIEPDSATHWQTTSYGYDSFGNKNSVTVTGPDIAPRTTSTYWGTDGLFPLSLTNAAGLTETRVYDPRFGVVKELVGPNGHGLKTTWTYDSFGRKSGEIRPDGTTTMWSESWCTYDYTCKSGEQYSARTDISGGTPSIVYYDFLGRPVRSAHIGFNGLWLAKETKYDAFGRVHKTSNNYQQLFGVSDNEWTITGYDEVGRVNSVTTPEGVWTSNNYNGLITTQTITPIESGKPAQVTERKNDAMGQLIRVKDAENGSTFYNYDVHGNLVWSKDAGGNITKMGYDVRGRKAWMDDPDMGYWTYSYYSTGELKSQTDAKQQTATMSYDKLGRMIRRTELGADNKYHTSSWVYFGAGAPVGSRGKLRKLTGPFGFQRIHSYDTKGRHIAVTSTILNNTYTIATSYDDSNYGRLDTTTYPTGFAVKNGYDEHGYLTDVRNAYSGELYWRADGVNANGQVSMETLGNGLTTMRLYDRLSGRLTDISTGNGNRVQYLQYGYDSLGNLTSRSDYNQNLTETFSYDNLNRLRTATINGLAAKTYNYDAVGNIVYKSDVGAYLYGQNGAGPHAVTTAGGMSYHYDANGNLIAGGGRNLEYSAFNKPTYVSKNNAAYGFTYAPDHTRITQTGPEGTVVYLNPRIDLGNHYERHFKVTGVTEDRHYIYGGTGLVAVHTSRSNGTSNTRYMHKDHLGSIDAITDENAQLVEKFSYDAFGKRRLSDWRDDASGLLRSFTMKHGFTSHEHLDDVGLIHMNGRVYDPALGRFMSADPHIQSPANTQSFNRYSYVLNNPLTATDPSGYFFKKLKKAVKKYWRPIAAIAAAVVTGGAIVGAIGSGFWGSVAAGAGAGFASGAVATGTLRGAFTGAAFGALSAGVAWGIGHGGVGGKALFGEGLATHVAHGVSQGGISKVRGGDFRSGFWGGLMGSAVPIKPNASFQAKAVAGAVVGGTASVLGGGKFANGAVTGAFVHMFGEAAANDDSYEVEETLSVDSSDEPLMLASKGGKQNISVGGYNRNSNPADVKQAMDAAKQSGNQSHYRKLKGLLKVIKRGGRMIGPAVPTEILNEIYPSVPVMPLNYDIDTQEGFDACFASRSCT